MDTQTRLDEIDALPSGLDPMAGDEIAALLDRVGPVAGDYGNLTTLEAVRFIMASGANQMDAGLQLGIAAGGSGDVEIENV